MTAQPFSLSWSNFTGWLTDNKYQAPAWRYWTSYNMDTRWFYAYPNIDASNINTYATNINAVFNIEQVGWWDHNIVWTNDWKIYYDTTLKHSLSIWKQWYRIGTMKVSWTDYLYYFQDVNPTVTPKNIHRSSIDVGSVIEWHLTYTSTDWNAFIWPVNWMQVKSEWYRILFSHYNNVFEISNTEVVSKLIWFPSNENVVWITEFQWAYKIYTTVWFVWSKIYTWDWTSEAPELSIDMNWLPIASVINDWAYDYVTMIDWSFYKIAWVQFIELYNKIWATLFKNINWLIYWQLFNKNNQSWIFTYWSLPWYPTSIVAQYTCDTSNVNDYITNWDKFAYSSNYIYYAVWKSLKRIDWNNSTTFTSYIESLVFTGTNIEYEKTIKEIVLKFSNTTTTSYIRLEVQTQESWSWIKIYEWNNVTIWGTNHWTKIVPLNFLNPVGTFNTIRFKVSFVHNWSVSWRFYWLDLLGEENVWR